LKEEQVEDSNKRRRKRLL